MSQMEPLISHEVANNNLKGSTHPALPDKRGSTLMRVNPSQASLPRPHAPSTAGDSSLWESLAPPPPPRRDHQRAREEGLPGNSVEAVPLRNGDLLLENGNETILVRGNF